MNDQNFENIFQQLPYINIHAHLKENAYLNNEHFTLFNLDYSEFMMHTKTHYYSAGLHPWFIKEYNETWLNALAEMANHKNILAIGECGLDRNIKIDFALQQSVFRKQINLANEFKKPLIIHSVRAFYDVVSELKKSRNKMPVIFHGYNNSLKIAETLLQNNGYLSFGKSLLQIKNNTAQILKQLPIEKIFFESDESIFTIEAIFLKASEIFNLDVETLKMQSVNNFKTVFNI